MPDPYPSIVLVAALALPASAALAQLDAPASPDDPASAMFTLTDVYQRLAAGVPGARRAGAFVEPTSGPASSGFDLDDIMSVAPSPDEGTGATVPQCLAGRRYWSLQPASWGAHRDDARRRRRELHAGSRDAGDLPRLPQRAG